MRHFLRECLCAVGMEQGSGTTDQVSWRRCAETPLLFTTLHLKTSFGIMLRYTNSGFSISWGLQLHPGHQEELLSACVIANVQARL